MEHNFPQRKQMRMKYYDYSSNGRYYITVCARDRLNYFGYVANGIVYLNALGEIADHCIVEINLKYPSVFVLCRVVMPNHVHFILENADGPIADAEKDNSKQYTIQEKSKMLIPRIVQQYKSATTKQIKQAFRAYYYPEGANEPQEGDDLPVEKEDGMHEGITGSQKRADGVNVVVNRSHEMVDVPSKRYDGSQDSVDGLHERGDGLHNMQPLRWQRGYYDRIIRSEEEYRAIRKYIETNPQSYQDNEHEGRQ